MEEHPEIKVKLTRQNHNKVLSMMASTGDNFTRTINKLLKEAPSAAHQNVGERHGEQNR